MFFFSDHGAGLPRAKQFIYDSGMQVPLIIYFPPKWRHLAPDEPGSTVDRLVSFVDFGPTVLSLAGVPVPKHMQGKPFLGPQAVPAREFIYGIRDRMDERYDMSRTVRDNHFKYHRHYLPFVPHFPWLDYMEMTDSSLDVRIAAAQALCRSGHVDTGLPVLVKLLEHQKWAVRLASANAIDYLGSDARPAIPALRQIMTSNDKRNRNLRWVCGHTLRQLGVVDSPVK